MCLLWYIKMYRKKYLLKEENGKKGGIRVTTQEDAKIRSSRTRKLQMSGKGTVR